MQNDWFKGLTRLLHQPERESMQATALVAKCRSPVKGQDLLEQGITYLLGKERKGEGEKILNIESEM